MTRKGFVGGMYCSTGNFSADKFAFWINSKENKCFTPSGEISKDKDGRSIVCGHLFFYAIKGENDQILWQPSEINESPRHDCIKISFDIKMIFSENRFPFVRETKGEIKRVADRFNKNISDFHANESGECCLAGPIHQEEFLAKNNPESLFIEHKIIPFFVRVSLIDKGIPLPTKWGEYRHGLIGILEEYLDCTNGGENEALVNDKTFVCMAEMLKGYLDHPEAKNLFSCYHNPNKTKETITYSSEGVDHDVSIELCNLLKKIKSRYNTPGPRTYGSNRKERRAMERKNKKKK